MWLNSGKMFEKYNVATKCCKVDAGGGEYELQEGFGWTNGVVLDLLMVYKDELAWTVTDPLSIPDCHCCHVGPLPEANAEMVEPIIQEVIRKMSMSIQEQPSLLVQASAEA